MCICVYMLMHICVYIYISLCVCTIHTCVLYIHVCVHVLSLVIVLKVICVFWDQGREPDSCSGHYKIYIHLYLFLIIKRIENNISSMPHQPI